MVNSVPWDWVEGAQTEIALYIVNKERLIIASGCYHDSGNQEIGPSCPRHEVSNEQHGWLLVGMFVR